MEGKGRRQCGGSVSCEGGGRSTWPTARGLRTVAVAVVSALSLKEGKGHSWT
jgi:hypothetical protein